MNNSFYICDIVPYVYMELTFLYAVQTMVHRRERMLGSRSRLMKSNKDDPIFIDDVEVNYMNCFVN